MKSEVMIILRLLQLLLAITVLALSAWLASGQYYGSLPAQTVYGVCAGGVSIVTALLGVLEFNRATTPAYTVAKITLTANTVASLASLAGGIIFGVNLHGISCSNLNVLKYNSWFNGGCYRSPCYTGEKLQTRCNTVKADAALMFTSCVVCFCMAVASFRLFSQSERKKADEEMKAVNSSPSEAESTVVPSSYEADSRRVCPEVEGNDAVNKYPEAEGSAVYDRRHEIDSGVIAELPVEKS